MSVDIAEPLTTFDSMLGPVLTRTSGSASSVVFAVLVRGLREEVTAGDIRQWMMSRARGLTGRGIDSELTQQEFDVETAGPRNGATDTKGPATVLEVVSSDKLWSSLCRDAARYVLSSPSFTGDVRGSHLTTARWLFAGLLLPLPHSAQLLMARNVNVRVAMAGVAQIMLADDKGWDTAIVTEPRLASMLGWDAQMARRNLKLLQELGMITRLRDGRGVHGRFRLNNPGAERIGSLGKHAVSVVAFVDGQPDPLADLIRSVTHPAWAHSSTLAHTHWLTLIYDAAGVDVTQLSMRDRYERDLRKTMKTEHLEVATLPYLRQILDDIASDPGRGHFDEVASAWISPDRARAVAVATYREKAEARKLEVTGYKEDKSIAFVTVNELLADHPVPASPSGGRRSSADVRSADLMAWAKKMRALIGAVVAAGGLDEKQSSLSAEILYRRMLNSKHKHDALDARDVIDFIFGA